MRRCRLLSPSPSSRAKKEIFVQASLSMEGRIHRRDLGKVVWRARIEE